MTRTLKGAFGAGVAVAALLAGLAAAEAGTLKIESWRNDDADIWNNKIIPAFNKHYPDIKVVFTPIGADRIQRRAQLAARRRHRRRPHHLPAVRRLARPLQEGHQLDRVNDLTGMENFSDVAKAAWTTDDGKTTFCVPMASVIHGFIYNKDIFDEGRS